MDNLRQRVRDAANRAGLPRFWRWWIGELAPLMPAASRIALQRRFVRPVIEFAEGEAVLWRPEFGAGLTRLTIAEKVSLSGDAAAVLAAGRAAVSRLAANASGGIAAPKVVIALASRRVLRKQITLPAAVEENLMQTLAYDLDRHTPFKPEQLYFDAVVVSRDAARKTMRVDWAAALRSDVDDARRQVEAWGAVPRAVVPGPPATAVKLNLIPDAVRPRQLEWQRWQVWAPLAGVVVIGLAAVIVPVVQKREYAIALAALNTEAAQQAQAADAVRQQLEAMQSDYNYILAKKYAYPSVVHLLDEVTRVLPDDTWLTQFELKTTGRGKEIQRDLYLRGESGNAGKLIALLEDSKLVDQAAPRSPTTKIQGASGEIFDVGARLRTQPLPEPQAVAMMATAPPAAPSPPARATPPAPAAPASVPAASSAPAPATTAPQAAQPAASQPAPAPIAAPAPAPFPPVPAEPVSPTTAAGFGPFPNAPVQPSALTGTVSAPRPATPRAARPAAPTAPAGSAPAAPVPATAGVPARPRPGAEAPAPAPDAGEPDQEEESPQ